MKSQTSISIRYPNLTITFFLFALLFQSIGAQAIKIDVVFGGGIFPSNTVGDGDPQSAVRAAADYWEAALPETYISTITVEWKWLPGEGAGATITDTDGNIFDRPVSGVISFGNGDNWFIDPTPYAAEEWSTYSEFKQDLGAGPVNTGRVFSGYQGELIDGKIPKDFFTVAVHEMGHILGIATGYNSYEKETADGDVDIGSNYFNNPTDFNGSSIPIVNAGAHLAIPESLMWIDPTGFFTENEGQRRYPSAIDILAANELSTYFSVDINPFDKTTLFVEAESLTLSGGSTIDSNHPGFSGDGFVNFPSDAGSMIWSNIDGGEGGNVTLALRYALGDAYRTVDLVVNGISPSFTFSTTGAWTAYAELVTDITLQAGTSNYLEIVTTGEDSANVDSLELGSSKVFGDSQAPLPPTQIFANVVDNAIELSWQANSESDLAYYNIYRSLTPGFKLQPDLLLTRTKELSYNDTEASDGFAYYYIVSAVDLSANESLPSTEVSETIEPSSSSQFYNIQAESGLLSGNVTVDFNHAGYEDNGFLNYPLLGGAVEWTDLNGGSGGIVLLTLRYALGNKNSRDVLLTVNDQEKVIRFSSTGGWSNWDMLNLEIEMQAGFNNTLRIESIGEDSANLDSLLFEVPSY